MYYIMVLLLRLGSSNKGSPKGQLLFSFQVLYGRMTLQPNTSKTCYIFCDCIKLLHCSWFTQVVLLSHAFTYIFNNTRLSHRMTNLCAVAAFFWIQRLKNQFWNPTSADASTGQVKQQQEIFILALNLLINSLHQIQLRDCDTRKKQKKQPRGKALVSKFFFCCCSCSTYTWWLHR